MRLAVVDDPFGGAHSVPSALREMESLDRLICDLSVHRRIIVAQSEDRLSEVVRGASLAKLRTGGLAWIQLDPLSQKHLAEIWRGLCLRRKVPEGLASLVANALSAGDLTLEPGCLVHLAYNYESLPPDARLADVERLGLQNANSFGRALATEGFAALLEALAVATTPQRPIHLTELAFVMGHGGPARPSESNVTGTMVSFGGGPPPSSPEPRYGPDPSLTEAELRELELLELRRIIEEIGTDTLGFSHSFYRAGAESLLDAPTIAAGHRLVTHVERAIFSLSPVTASAAAANLHWLYSSSAERAPVRIALVEAAKAGLKSIFPVTRDACFAFLSSVLASLPVKEQAEVTQWVTAVTAFAASEVGWFRGEPRIPQANALSDVLELDLARPSPNDASIRAVVAVLNSTDAAPITPQEAALALPHYESHPKELSAQAVSRLLSFDVGLIRAPAAAAWLRIPRENDEVILSRIFGDDHPAVGRAVYRSVVIAWWECDATRREILRLGLLRLASSPTGAASLVDQMVLFGRAEFGELPPWELFGSLMPLVLQMLPPGTALHDARLYDVVRTASKHISVDALLSIVDRWIEYLEALPSARTASDYLLGCTVVLVEGTRKSPHLREARLLKFLQLRGTATRIRVVADLTDLWQHLRDDERQELQRHLAAEATDSVWLSAAVLTREEVPEQLGERILPARFSLSEGPAAILSSLEPELVNACLLIYTGGHPTLYSVGAHGNGGEMWDPVVEAVALSPTHELFEVAWEHLANGDDGARSARLIRALGTPNALRLFELMMSRKLRTTGDFMPKAWEALFEVAPDAAVRTEWLKRMALAAPRVLDGLFEVKQWIPQEYRNEFLAEFPGDLNVYKFLSQLDDASEIALPPGHEVRSMLNDAMIEFLRKIIDTTPPAHGATFEHAAAALRRHGVDGRGLLEELEQRRLAAHPSYEGSPQPYIPGLRNWVN